MTEKEVSFANISFEEARRIIKEHNLTIKGFTFKDGKHTFTMKLKEDYGYIVTEIDGKKITEFSKEEIQKIQKETRAFKDAELIEVDDKMLKLVFPPSKSYIS